MGDLDIPRARDINTRYDPLTVAGFAVATTQQRCAIFDRSARSPFLAAPPFRCPLSEPSVPSLFTS